MVQWTRRGLKIEPLHIVKYVENRMNSGEVFKRLSWAKPSRNRKVQRLVGDRRFYRKTTIASDILMRWWYSPRIVESLHLHIKGSSRTLFYFQLIGFEFINLYSTTKRSLGPLCRDEHLISFFKSLSISATKPILIYKYTINLN